MIRTTIYKTMIGMDGEWDECIQLSMQIRFGYQLNCRVTIRKGHSAIQF